MTNLEQIAMAAYGLGQMDAILSVDEDEDIDMKLPGILRLSFQGAQEFFAGILQDHGLSEKSYNREDNHRTSR